jgi:thiol-disulfide isomerase/thioredoxin
MRPILLLLLLLSLAACGPGAGENEVAGPDQPGWSGPPEAPPTGRLDRSHAGEAAPATGFEDPDGAPASLADFRGKPVLLNLWATWCAPCIKELPTLDKLSRQPGAPQVVALSQDMQPHATVATFLQKRRIALEAFQDSDMAMSSALGVNILPTTILYGADGKEVWRYSGDLDWSGAEAAKLLAEAP